MKERAGYLKKRIVVYIVCMGSVIAGYGDRIHAYDGMDDSYVTMPAELVVSQEDIGVTRAGKRKQRREQVSAKKALKEREENRSHEEAIVVIESEDIEDTAIPDEMADEMVCTRKRKRKYKRESGRRKSKSQKKVEYLQQRTDELQAMMLINPLERNAAGFVRTPEENRELARELSERAQELQKKGFAINMVHVEAKVKELMQEPGSMNAIARDYADQVEEWKKAYADKVQEIHQREIVTLEQSQHIQTLEQQREELIQEKERLTAECARSMETLRDDVRKETTAKEECEKQVQRLRDQVQELKQAEVQKEEVEKETEVPEVPATTEQETEESVESVSIEAPEKEEKETKELGESAEAPAEQSAVTQTTEVEVPELIVPEQTGVGESEKTVTEEQAVTPESGVIEQKQVTEKEIALPVPAEEATTEETVTTEEVALAQKNALKNRMQRGKVVVYAAPA